jgi:hypothetical protein
MAQETRLTRYREQTVEPFDKGRSVSGFKAYASKSYRSMLPMAAKGDFLPDDPIPLFLSGPAEETKPPGLGRAWDSAVTSSRILKTGILVVAATAIVFATLSLGNPIAVFATATASLVGISAPQSGAGQSAPAIQSSADAQTLPRTTRGAPTRDEIAAAFKAAHQSRTEIRQPSAAAPPARSIDADELAALMKRAKGLIAIGDIAAARLLLERAADAQEPSAALLLAQTYDPAVLGKPDARSITPDPVTARGWYQNAARLGSQDAQRRLDQMRN